MKKTKCMCGRQIPDENHTGECQLDHFISYTANGQYGFDNKELRRIVGIIKQESRQNKENGKLEASMEETKER